MRFVTPLQPVCAAMNIIVTERYRRSIKVNSLKTKIEKAEAVEAELIEAVKKLTDREQEELLERLKTEQRNYMLGR